MKNTNLFKPFQNTELPMTMGTTGNSDLSGILGNLGQTGHQNIYMLNQTFINKTPVLSWYNQQKPTQLHVEYT
jgi:hypothetical protein